MDRDEPAWDVGLDAELEDRLSGGSVIDPIEEGRATDLDFADWLTDRERDWDDERLAEIDRAAGWW